MTEQIIRHEFFCQFKQIHRSHVVHTAHIRRIAKNGRDHKVMLQRFAVELPVSRSRLKDLRPNLMPADAVK